MKLYGIIESYFDYKGADATNWGVRKSLEEAKNALFEILEQQFHYIRESLIYEIEEENEREATPEEVESRWQEWIGEHLEEGGYGDCFSYKFEFDDGNSIYKFYIDEINLEL